VRGPMGGLCCAVFINDLLVVLNVNGWLCWGLGAGSALDHY
jgi:hypothetical protein